MNRAEATLNRYSQYDGGKHCPLHGQVYRYTTSGACVLCASLRKGDEGATGVSRKTGDRTEREMNADAWREAQRQGVPVYERVSPCNQCADAGVPGSVLRYTSNGGCVACQKRRAAEQYDKRMSINQNAPHPVSAQASSCGHGAEVNALIPELQGKTLAYSRHVLFNHLSQGRTHHYGKCVACHPSRAISMFNQMSEMRPITPEYAYTWHMLSRLMERTNEYPSGYLSECMRRYNLGKAAHKRGGPLNIEKEKPVLELDPKKVRPAVIDWVNGVKAAPVVPMTSEEKALLQAKSIQRFDPERLTIEQKALLGIPDIKLP